jgi:Periplasmic protease
LTFVRGTLLQGGIQKGDTFLEVDGVKFDDGKSTPDDVASKLRGPEGSKVGIVMKRDGKVQDFILTREPITITSVRSYMSDKAGVGKVGVVRIKSFSGTTAQTVKDAIVDLKKKGAEALVLDLRGNPGGLLPGGVDTAALFLEANKPVVFVVDKRGVQDNQFTYQDGPELDTPLVVVVNGNTASAAEVMTAALKENQRATIVGEQTFGKGIIQTIRQLGYDNGGVAVTVARYEHRCITTLTSLEFRLTFLWIVLVTMPSFVSLLFHSRNNTIDNIYNGKLKYIYI